MKSRKNYKKGISLLIAVLLSSVALLFSFAVSKIALREIILAQAGRDSQVAFYASNNGVECALFWDLKHGTFNATTTNSTGDIECNEQTFNGTWSDCPDGGDITWCRSAIVPSDDEFLLDYQEASGPRFIIEVRKEGTTEGVVETTVISRGYNTDFGSLRILERAIEVKY